MASALLSVCDAWLTPLPLVQRPCGYLCLCKMLLPRIWQVSKGGSLDGISNDRSPQVENKTTFHLLPGGTGQITRGVQVYFCIGNLGVECQAATQREGGGGERTRLICFCIVYPLSSSATVVATELPMSSITRTLSVLI